MSDALTIGAGRQRDRGAHLIVHEHESEAADQPRPARVWFTACVFSVLAMLYHADNSFAQIIRGSTDDGAVSVQWEYDLGRGTAKLVLRNIKFKLDPNGERLYFGRLIPCGATDVQFSREVVQIDALRSWAEHRCVPAD